MQTILREMFKNNKKYQVSDMIQNMIYFFNQPKIRDYVLSFYIRNLPAGKKVHWDGTYFFNEKAEIDPYHHPGFPNLSLQEFLKKKPLYTDESKKGYVLSTCCITYEGNRVHFLSMIYNKKKKLLLFFDPGIHLYERGQDVAVPIVVDAFLKNGWITKPSYVERVGLCSNLYHGKKWGIQYNGNDPKTTKLPADSFCQSWTIYYLIEFLRNKCSDRFFSNWCSIPPKKRETFMMMNFFLPLLQIDNFVMKEWREFYPHGELTDVNEYVIETFSQP